MQWYYSKNGTQLGPISEAELRAKLSAGEVSPADLVWKEGMGDWLPTARIPELLSAAQLLPPTLGNVENSPYVPPVAPGYPVQPAMAGAGTSKATTSMVLGIVGLVFGICGCYGFVIALPCCILAIVFGNQYNAEVTRNPLLASEQGKAKAGVIMGWIGIGLSVVLTLGLLALGAASSVMH